PRMKNMKKLSPMRKSPTPQTPRKSREATVRTPNGRETFDPKLLNPSIETKLMIINPSSDREMIELIQTQAQVSQKFHYFCLTTNQKKRTAKKKIFSFEIVLMDAGHSGCK